MKEVLNNEQLDKVVGGTVVMSEPLMKIGFNTVGEVYDLKVANYKDARNLLMDLYDNNSGLPDAEFDQLVKKEFLVRGWI